MRLSEAQIQNLTSSIKSIDKDARIYLFGSRTDDQKKGGDIDLAVFSDHLDGMQKSVVKEKFFRIFGAQKIDIVVLQSPEDLFWQVIKDHSILLSA